MLPNLSALSTAPTAAAYAVASLSELDNPADWTPGALYDELPDDLTGHLETAEERKGTAQLYISGNNALLLLTASKLMETNIGKELAPVFARRAKWLAYRVKCGILDCEPESFDDFTDEVIASVVEASSRALDKLRKVDSLYVFFTEEDQFNPDRTDLAYVYLGAYMREPGVRRGPFRLDCAKNGYKIESRLKQEDRDEANELLVELAGELGDRNVQNTACRRMFEPP